MGVIGSRSTALWSVIEYHHLWILGKQLVNLAIGITNQLRLVLYRWNGKVDGQDGEGVDQQVELSIDRFLNLLLGAILLAQETGALGQCLLVNLSAC